MTAKNFEYSPFGSWVEPDGTIHAMTKYQVHKQWMFDLHGSDWGEEKYNIETEAERRGWVLITLGMLATDFAIDFHENKVTKKAIDATRQILKGHDPDDPVHINDCLGMKDGYFPWKKAYGALAKYPEAVKPKQKLRAPMRGLSKAALKTSPTHGNGKS